MTVPFESPGSFRSPQVPEIEPRLLPSRFRGVHYYARYFGDPISRLFWLDGELWMGLLPPHGYIFGDLLASHAFDDLIADRLLADLESVAIHEASQHAFAYEDFQSVYRIKHTPRVIYWHEWSPKMWRSAAMRLVELLLRLAQKQLTLRNPHPWNLLYDGRSFVYINPGSIVPLDRETFTRTYEKVARFFVRPLLLVENGFAHIAQRLIADLRDGVSAKDAERVQEDWSIWKTEPGTEAIVAFLTKLESALTSLQCNTPGHRWLEYAKTHYDFHAETSWGKKQIFLERMLEDAEIRSVVDLGANTGHYARVAAQHGREVIAIDFDPALVDATFEESRKARLSVYPVVMDILHPTAGQGVASGWFPPATERLGADLVLCFALSHHLIFGKYRLNFEQLACGVKCFARAWAVLEYVERGRIRPAEWRPDANSWYTIGNLALALRRHFPVVEILPAAADGRQLLICGPERRLL